MGSSEVTESDLLDELTAAAERPHIQPGDVTRKQLQEAWKCSESAVVNRMNELMQSGKYSEHFVTGRSGRWCWVYRRAR